jgi:hypothetical protein
MMGSLGRDRGRGWLFVYARAWRLIVSICASILRGSVINGCCAYFGVAPVAGQAYGSGEVSHPPLPAHGRCGARRDASEKWTHEPPAGMSRHLCGESWSLGEGAWPVDAGEIGPDHDVLTAGSGTRESKAVTRCSSALTGQALGRWRRIRSLVLFDLGCHFEEGEDHRRGLGLG